MNPDPLLDDLLARDRRLTDLLESISDRRDREVRARVLEACDAWTSRFAGKGTDKQRAGNCTACRSTWEGLVEGPTDYRWRPYHDQRVVVIQYECTWDCSGDWTYVPASFVERHLRG